MKAVIYTKYGPPGVLKLVDIEKPQPKHNEVLVKIYATTVTSGDARLRNSDFSPVAWFFVRLMYGLLKKAILRKGQHVLVFGASGSVGSFALQIAKAYDATVVAVCSGANIDMVKSLGADSAVDYKNQDYCLLEQKFDIIFGIYFWRKAIKEKL